MGTSPTADESRTRLIWSMRLTSALRTASACAIVGVATLYGPKFLTHHIKFAAFSYLTAVVTVSDAALGDAMRGCWHAFCATAQVVPLAMLWRWGAAPAAGLPVSMAAAVVAAAAFVVALPEWTHLTAKKIAFGQIVLVCTDAVLSDGASDGYMHPLYLAASTALGALASLLALLIPYPGLACYKVRKLRQVYSEIASQRMNIYLKAFGAKDQHTKMELMSQARPLAETGAKLLQSIRILQEGMQWEKPWSRLRPAERLERMEQQMKGIEYSLVSSTTFPVQEIDQDQLSNFSQSILNRVKEKIEQDSSETKEFLEKPSPQLDSTFSTPKQGWVCFYFSCIDMLLNDTSVARKELKTPHQEQPKFSIIKAFKTWIQKLTLKRFEFAFKCSLSLSLATLFGFTFDKENGCWAGLTIAISFTTGRQAIFTMANTRAQGTAIGSAYGVICCFLFHDEEMRLLALLPWIVFTGFLRHSKMYGQTGGVSAAIGALLILGRQNYGLPNDFAIARLTEVFIGLSAFIAVELFLQPIRAATLAKNHLFMTLHALQDCIKGTHIWPMQKNQTILQFLELKEKQGYLDSLVSELEKVVADAELEPDFWYLPFRTSCYRKLVHTLSNIRDLLYFITYNFGTISELLEATTFSKEFQEQINHELQLFQEVLSSSRINLQQGTSTESQAYSEDLEAGLRNTERITAFITTLKEAEGAKQGEDTEDNTKVREKLIRCLSAIGFCISSLMKELENINICIREIEHWNN